MSVPIETSVHLDDPKAPLSSSIKPETVTRRAGLSMVSYGVR